MSDASPLFGRTALVTGAGKRIGRAIALELGRAGCDVVVHVNRSRAEGEDTAREIQRLGARAAVVEADQREPARIEAACRAAERALGAPTLLVASAAIWPRVDFLECTQEDFDLALEVNLRGPFFWARHLAPGMKAAGSGAIVAIADVSAFRPWPDALPYGMSKAGLVSMVYGLARALAPEVRVNAIGPGPIVFPEGYPEADARRDREATLRGREGEPEDVARAARHLLENENVTGAFLPVDGGYRFGI